MFKIATIAPEAATGAVARVYGQFPPQLGVPLVFRLLSASPDLLERQLGQMAFWKGRERFGEAMLASLRYLLATRLELEGCRAMNATLLKLGGLDDAQIAALDGAPAGWLLTPERRALTAFAGMVLGVTTAITVFKK